MHPHCICSRSTSSLPSFLFHSGPPFLDMPSITPRADSPLSPRSCRPLQLLNLDWALMRDNRQSMWPWCVLFCLFLLPTCLVPPCLLVRQRDHGGNYHHRHSYDRSRGRYCYQGRLWPQPHSEPLRAKATATSPEWTKAGCSTVHSHD